MAKRRLHVMEMNRRLEARDSDVMPGNRGTFPARNGGMLSKRIVVISGLAFLVIVIASALDSVRPYFYLRLCNLYRDAVNRGGRTTPANPELVFLAIDVASVNLDESDIDDFFKLAGNESKEVRALRLMTQHYPWPREVYALVL